MHTHFNPLHQNTAQREAASATLPDASGKMAHATISELTMPHTGVVQSEAATNSMVKQNNLLHDMTMSTARVGDTVPLDSTSQSPPAASQLPVHSTIHDANATALDLTMAKTGTVHPEGRPDSMVKHHNPLHETSPAAESGSVPFDTMYDSPPAASQLPAHSATQGARAQAADVTVSALTMPNTGAPHMLMHPSEMALQQVCEILHTTCSEQPLPERWKLSVLGCCHSIRAGSIAARHMFNAYPGNSRLLPEELYFLAVDWGMC